jgi:hypothetical protein
MVKNLIKDFQLCQGACFITLVPSGPCHHVPAGNRTRI